MVAGRAASWLFEPAITPGMCLFVGRGKSGDSTIIAGICVRPGIGKSGDSTIMLGIRVGSGCCGCEDRGCEMGPEAGEPGIGEYNLGEDRSRVLIGVFGQEFVAEPLGRRTAGSDCAKVILNCDTFDGLGCAFLSGCSARGIVFGSGSDSTRAGPILVTSPFFSSSNTARTFGSSVSASPSLSPAWPPTSFPSSSFPMRTARLSEVA